jgi:hypothetical protein
MQRLPDILGDDSGTEPSVDGGTVPGITAWSIQAQMIRNYQTIIKSLVGIGSYGRIMCGLKLEINGSICSISPGYGFTQNGHIITILNSCAYQSFTEGINHLYLTYKTGIVDANSLEVTGGLNTNVIGEPGSFNVVCDEYGASQGSQISQSFNKIIFNSGSSKLSDNDWLYLGYVTNTSGTLVATPTNLRGFYPNTDGGDYGIIDKLKSSVIENNGGDLEIKSPKITGLANIIDDAVVGGDVNIGGDAYVTGKTTLVDGVAGNPIFDGNVTVRGNTVLNHNVNIGGETVFPVTPSSVKVGSNIGVTDTIVIAGTTLVFMNGILISHS